MVNAYIQGLLCALSEWKSQAPNNTEYNAALWIQEERSELLKSTVRVIIVKDVVLDMYYAKNYAQIS